MDRDQSSLIDIVKMARLSIEFVRQASREDLQANHQLRLALLHALVIIGEAVKRLSPEFRRAHAEIPWKLIAGTRDRLIHGYDDVNLDTVWEIVTAQLPELVAVLEPLLPSKPK